MASSTANFLSRGDLKKSRELEEARKAGTIPAELDEDGKEINPHIPEFMAKAPWYLNAAGSAPGLKHQKAFNVKEHTEGLDAWYRRGVKAGPSATKFRKGACPNCGALTHALADCLARPRAKSAKYTNADIQNDEYLNADLNLTYDGKRDRFAGFDITQYEAEVGVRFNAEDEARKAHVHEQKLKALESTTGGLGGGELDEDGLLQREDEAVARVDQLSGTRQGAHKMSVRNLRIREDTAKYLLNLNVNSAYYDPKTRSMRDNPRPDSGMPQGEDAGVDGGAFVGDNFVRHRGETLEMMQLQQYTADAYERGQDLNINSEPTQVELMNRLFREKKEKLASTKKSAILDKYGGDAHLQAVDPRLLLDLSGGYAEYDRNGRLRDKDGTGGAAASGVVRSRFDEDVFHTNHTAVWGSFFDRATMRWGYADDTSTTKHSYSTGAAGKRARDLAAASIAAGMGGPTRAELLARERAANGAAEGGGVGGGGAVGGGEVVQQEAAKAMRAPMAPPARTMYGIGEGLGEQDIDSSKLKAALAREKARQRGEKEAEKTNPSQPQGKKRGYNSMAADTVTAEDMEAYYMSKNRGDDPMSKMADTVED